MQNMRPSISIEFEPVIGLEVHLQLNTKTKIFCGCANTFGREPNSHTCPVCLGLPGTLPVLNKKALEYAIKIALALHCEVNPLIKFDRKNYYYPDLPKGYQISQYDLPIAQHGLLVISSGGQAKKIRIRRGHLEEDAGKLIHDDSLGCSLVDYNRTGTPLMEIVTEPDLHSSQEAYDYLHILKLTLQYLDVSDCDMEKGSLRCDANVSLREKGSTTLGTKTELKNMNSFKAVKTALDFEIRRHQEVLQNGERVVQETRLWNETKGTTFSMRSKEEAHDYRYFPEPDLVPFVVDKKMIDAARQTLPEMPDVKLQRLIRDYQIPDYDAGILIQDPALADFFEQCAKANKGIESKKICNWIQGALLQELNARKKSVTTISLTVQNFTDLILKVENGALSNLAGKDVLKYIIDSGKSVDAVIQEKGLAQVSDDQTLDGIVENVIKENEKVVQQVKEGKASAIGFLVGQAMKKTEGKANPKKIGDLFRRRLLNE
jgi:aspartyl-tRNA(Asn)/glutamyl-tRNA(Gln) amidotransferase subunit B